MDITIDRESIAERLLTQVTDDTRTHYLSYLRRLDLDGSHTVADIKRRVGRIPATNSRRAIVIGLRSMVPELKDHLPIEESVARIYDLSVVPTFPRNPRHMPALLMQFAGLRVGEAVAVTRADVVGRVLRVDRTRGNDGTIRPAKTRGNVVLPTWLALRAAEWDGTAILPNSEGKFLRRRYGVTPHALRHWYATRLIQGGASPELVRRQLRHKHLTTTLRTYVQVELADMFDAVDALA